MKVPETFVKEKNKQATQEELEESIKKTLVDKILVENIAKELGKRIEGEILAKRMSISFRKTFNLEEEKLETITEKNPYSVYSSPYEIRNETKLEYKTMEFIFNKEQSQILEKITQIEPNLKEDEMIQKDNRCVDILSKDVIYELSMSNITSEIRKETGKTEPYQKKIYKRSVLKFFRKKLVGEENVELPLVDVYKNLVVYGEVKYVKFNFEHNAKLLKALKGLGYECSMNILEDKCKR